ncbi:MAG: hypothetical protein DWQ40_09825 [Actinobacteria bacterium]|nr:MAG: hypothetical protein DWQ40_09825 [Actinomycetota bacterium]REK40477.1 MAG: hypothetical protein DWQ20_01850 [Actinomycetota bacterium]
MLSPVPEERFSLKDHLFNKEKVDYLSGLLEEAVEGFDRARFSRTVVSGMADLELKQRVAFIAGVLTDYLSPDFETAAKQISNALPPPLDPTLTDDDFGDFILAPFGQYVQDHGLEHFDISMGLIKEITKRFSMEGPIRPFIDAYPGQTLEVLQTWARDENYHVRRLVSEGTRPLLPWAPRISLDVRDPLPLLDLLHADPTRYVTRSVANHLNDIAKIEPGLTVDTLRRWRSEAKQDPAELDWMTNHALRTLIKRGDPAAMELLGYSPQPSVEARLDVATPIVRPGEALEFSVDLRAGREENLIVDYTIDFVKKSGATSGKVFKLKRLSMESDEDLTLVKRHPLRANATTYSLYPGLHSVTVMVNGVALATADFEVVTD